MKKIYFFILAIFAGMMFISCTKSDCDCDTPQKNEKEQPLRIPSDSALVAQGNAFAMKLFAIANAQNPDDENVVLSPLSLNMALAMVWNGANGDTKTAIQVAMGMENYAPDAVNEYFKTIREGFMQTDAQNTQLALANSIWYRPEFPVKQPFIDMNTLYYNALVQQLDFNRPDATDILNQWCSDNTNGLIKDMFSLPIPDDVIMYLINALYFKSVWADSLAFDPEKTFTAQFQKSATEYIDVQMMRQTNEFQYFADENLQLVTLPYGNGAFSMTFILPTISQENMYADPEVFLDMTINALQEDGYWQYCLNNRHLRHNYDILIPKFKVRYDTEEKLKPILTELGMGVAFSDFADFSGIFDVPTLISKVQQKTYIDVNEVGTEAAAVTAIGMIVTSVQPAFT
ncbi:MAG: serpin family protein, partial [Prevotellaceae bacterium]|nr:serpin family protein [Prevotellaceae bacterium]